MHTVHRTAVSPGLLHVIWTQAGFPAPGRTQTSKLAGLRRMLAVALRLRDELDTYIAGLDDLIQRCPETLLCRCGQPLPERSTGRPAKYCSDTCGKRARRSRTGQSTGIS